MTRVALISLMIWLVGTFSAATRTPLCPKHRVTPAYLRIGRTAHRMGKVTLTLTIDERGNVQNAEAAKDSSVQQAHLLLQKYAIREPPMDFPKAALGPLLGNDRL
jgi:hypothetical protein